MITPSTLATPRGSHITAPTQATSVTARPHPDLNSARSTLRAGFAGLLMLLAATAPARANSANISCGDPSLDGNVTVTVRLEDGTDITWTAAISATDNAESKAAKIRAAAPPEHDDLITHFGTSGTVAGGTANAVVVTSSGDAKIKSISISQDDTNESEVTNVFSCSADMSGVLSLAGIASGVTADGAPGYVAIAVGTAEAFVPTEPGMPAELIEDLLIEQLQLQGVPVELAAPAWLDAYFGGVEHDGRVIALHGIAEPGQYTDCQDVGLRVDLTGLTDTFDRSAPWYEDFEAYLPGESLQCGGGWKGWAADPAFGGVITDQQARSGQNSVEVLPTTDLVRDFAGADSGAWTFSTWQYLSADFVSGCDAGALCGTYLVLLNTYNETGPFDDPSWWSVQIGFDSTDGKVKAFHGEGTSTIDVPYIVDQWVPIDVVVDLDNDWTRIYYDDNLLTEYSWTGGVLGTGDGAARIAAVDLYGNGSSSVFYDDFVLQPLYLPGDVNCDGAVDFADINPFTLLLANPSAWQMIYPDCPQSTGDINGDGAVNFGDINPFVALLSGG